MHDSRRPRAARWGQRLALALSAALLLALGIGPRTGAYQTLTVLTGSMRPSIPAGAVVVVTPGAASDVAAGDVITYEAPETEAVFTHRVVRVLEPGERPVVVTRGDANPTEDEPVRLEGGRVWTVRVAIPYLGWALQWLRQPLVHRLTLWASPVAFALLLLWSIWAPRARRDEHLEPLQPVAPRPTAPPAPARTGWATAVVAGWGTGSWYSDALAADRPDRAGPRRTTRRVATLVGSVLVVSALLVAPALALLSSSVTQATGTISTGALAPPTGLSAARGCTTLPAQRWIDLAWTPTSDTLSTDYVVERSTTGATSGFTSLATVGAATTGYRDGSLAASTQYWYRLRSVRSGWTSAPTSTVTQTTQSSVCL